MNIHNQYRKGDRIDYVIDYDDIAECIQVEIKSIERQAEYAVQNNCKLVYCKSIS
jgi:hypothetical protein